MRKLQTHLLTWEFQNIYFRLFLPPSCLPCSCLLHLKLKIFLPKFRRQKIDTIANFWLFFNFTSESGLFFVVRKCYSFDGHSILVGHSIYTAWSECSAVRGATFILIGCTLKCVNECQYNKFAPYCYSNKLASATLLSAHRSLSRSADQIEWPANWVELFVLLSVWRWFFLIDFQSMRPKLVSPLDSIKFAETVGTHWHFDWCSKRFDCFPEVDCVLRNCDATTVPTAGRQLKLLLWARWDAKLCMHIEFNDHFPCQNRFGVSLCAEWIIFHNLPL